MTRRQRVAAILLLVGIAAFFRFHRIDAIPPGLAFDEGQNGVDVTAIARGERLPIMVEAGESVKGRTREPLFHYLAAGMFRVFGPGVTALRSTSALIGTLTVIALFFAGERLFGTRVAFVAAFLLAVARWHVTFSRIGLRAVLVPLCIVLTVAAATALARRRSAAAAAALGAALALGWYTYQAYWVVPGALAIVLAVHLWRTRFADTPEWLALGALAAVVFLVGAAPIIGYAIAKPDYYFARVLEVTDALRTPQTRAAELRNNLQEVLFMLHLRSRSPSQFGFRWRPMLDPVSGAAFLAGLYFLLKRSRLDAVVKVGLIVFWLVPLLPGAMGRMTGSVMRAIGALPAVCALAALGLCGVFPSGRAGWRARAAPVLLAAALTVIAAVNYVDYFRRWAVREDVAQAYAVDTCRFFDFYAGLGGEADVYLSPAVYNSPNLRFLALARGVELPLIDRSAFVAADAASRDRVFVSEWPEMNSLIEDVYPEHEVLARYDLHGEHTGRVYRVAAKNLRRAFPAERSAEIAYWTDAMLRDFQLHHERW